MHTAVAASRLAPLAVVAASLAVAVGCGEDTIKQDGAEKSVGDVVFAKTRFRPTDVKCPSGVEAKAGKTFDCTFTGPEPKPYVAHVRITKVDGSNVHFFIESVPKA